ncbi:MAG: hypothetical protein M5R42_06940 [Rhodocyclaceae bacterium]|nr:hypothetical protein [Rhodocyclaceae bacterium]
MSVAVTSGEDAQGLNAIAFARERFSACLLQRGAALRHALPPPYPYARWVWAIG